MSRIINEIDKEWTEEEKFKKLIVHGQGVIIFKCSKPISFPVLTKDRKDGLNINFEKDKVYVSRISTNEKYIDPNNKLGIISNDGAYYWFSLDSQNQVFYAGIGEARIETKIYEYKFNPHPVCSQSEHHDCENIPSNMEINKTDKNTSKKNKKFLESLYEFKIEKCDIQLLKILKFPISMTKVPLLIKTMNDLTMMDLAKQTYMPLENLSLVSQKLYNCIGGKKFILDDDDFPEFSQAIEYSIATEGCWCNTRIKEKSTEFNPDKPNILETYLRITMGYNNGDSPGKMLVMEIWPKGGHFSPIHSHAGCEAIIRVLHGSINVRLYPYLSGQKDEIEPFGIANFSKDDFTWISPTMNQTHKLTNLSNENTCISIQVYEYDENDTRHYDFFDYIDEGGKIQYYEPDTDCDFVEFKKIIKKEWKSKK